MPSFASRSLIYIRMKKLSLQADALYLSLGSNMGDRKGNIRRALAMLEQKWGVPCEACSSLMETEPWGRWKGGATPFLNAVARFRLYPDSVLASVPDSKPSGAPLDSVSRPVSDVTVSVPDSKSSSFDSVALPESDVTASPEGKPGEMDKKALSILNDCKAVERALGREEILEYDSDGVRIYHPRPIDIDILLWGELRIDLPTLTIPHPLMDQRDFVLRPLAEIAGAVFTQSQFGR